MNANAAACTALATAYAGESVITPSNPQLESLGVVSARCETAVRYF